MSWKSVVSSLTIFASMSLARCATAPVVNDMSSTKIDVHSASSFKIDKPITATPSTGFANYSYQKQNYKAEWVKCSADPNAPYAGFFHAEGQGIDSSKFCSDWTAQVLLQQGYNVVAINRPGHGLSNGNADLAGPHSLAAILAGLRESQTQGHVVGFWGLEAGVIAATFTAKALHASTSGDKSNLKWLLCGQGFYDLEVIERGTQNNQVKQAFQALRSTEGDAAFEKRSIAWDVTGLPKTIGIYHSKLNTDAPKTQAEAFNDQLRTLQTKVFLEEIDGIDHDIPWQSHYQIVEKALKNLKSK